MARTVLTFRRLSSGQQTSYRLSSTHPEDAPIPAALFGRAQYPHTGKNKDIFRPPWSRCSGEVTGVLSHLPAAQQAGEVSCLRSPCIGSSCHRLCGIMTGRNSGQLILGGRHCLLLIELVELVAVWLICSP